MPPLRILIADDLGFMREALAALINREKDMQVFWEATNGEEAVRLFRLYQPCVTIMDMRMPVMDGVEATKQICTEFPTALVIAFTNSADEERERLLHAGAKACLSKEVSTHELVATIRNTHKTFAQAPPE